jgi:septal ring factor EnvC (AmiA/AmiB activator)
MNANELADLVECACCAYQKEAAAMLRQQQAEIVKLKNEISMIWLTKISVEPQIKELSTDEIIEIRQEVWDDNKFISEIFFDFARAILKKASEK